MNDPVTPFHHMLGRKKLTPWFDRGVKPAHVGVYPTEHGFQSWNGRFWGSFCGEPERAAVFARSRSMFQTPRWRGFTTEQKS
jgi:hypothetical protein